MGSFSHYSRLARHLGPARFAFAAARRVRRTARRALHRPGGWDPKVLLESLRLPPERALEQLLQSASHPAWCDALRRRSVVAALEHLPGSRSRALARARAAALRSFELFGTRIDFGAGKPINWKLSGEKPAAPDPKFAWALGRLDQLVALAQGAWVSRSPGARGRFTAEFIAQSEEFLAANPPGQGVQWQSPMEVSLRAANLAQGLCMLRDVPAIRAEGFALKALSSLIEHCEYVEAHLEDDVAVPNNHLVAGYVGLMVVGALFPNLPGASRWLEEGGAGVRAQMQAQVHPDGCSFEGSVPYHRLATELFTLALLASRAAGARLGAPYVERLRRMYRVAGAYCSERGLAPQIGDNDSGRVLPYRPRASLDHGYLVPLGAALLGAEELKRPGELLPDEAAWLLGVEGLRKFRRLPARWKERPFGSAAGGLHVQKGAGATVAVSAGAPGQGGVGGHSHNDRLSFELHLQGKPVIVDPGTGAYAGRPLRDRFRATAAHNTVQVDGHEQAPIDPGRPFALLGPSCELRARQAGARVDRLVARYASGRIEIERTLALDKKLGQLAVCDRLEGHGQHQLCLRLHLPDEEVRLRAPHPIELRRAGEGCAVWGAPGPVAAELGPSEGPRAVVLFAQGAQLSLEPSLYSPGYGELRPAKAVLARSRTRLPASLGLVVLFL